MSKYFEGQDLNLETIDSLDFTVVTSRDTTNTSIRIAFDVKANQRERLFVANGFNRVSLISENITLGVVQPNVFRENIGSSIRASVIRNVSVEDFDVNVTQATSESKNITLQAAANAAYTGITDDVFRLLNIRFFNDRSVAVNLDQVRISPTLANDNSLFFLPQLFLSQAEIDKGFTVNQAVAGVTGNLVVFTPLAEEI